jgi:hypothetical protein
MNLSTISLRLAFREPGCPICRLRQQAERRYLFNLLYENVNDGGTRRHLVRGLGLCPEHAWALQAIEQERWHDGLGVSIIYEDLARRVQASLREYQERNPMAHADRRTRLRQRLERLGAIGRWLAGRLSRSALSASLLARVSPTERCRACDLVGELEEINLSWLIQGLAEPEFRELYTASDGLCLPHLRRALSSAKDELAVHCLVEVTAARLDPLVADLGDYIRKHDWNNREEPKHPWERASWLRAVAFFAGEAPPGEGEDVYKLRRKAMIEYQQRGEKHAP